MTGPWKQRIEIGNCVLYHGDCLDIMPTIGKVDAVVTDPPYSSGARTSAAIRSRGGMSRGDNWKDKPLSNDQMTVTGFVWFMRQVMAGCHDILPDGGSVLSFIDWRQYPTLYGVIESVNFRAHNVVVWDKCTMGMGNGFRNRHEFLIHASKGVPTIFDKGTPNVISIKRISSSDIHPTEKPVELIEKLLPVVTEFGQIVFDPFMGSGTTLAACANTGRRGIGIELDAGYFETACDRVRGVYAKRVVTLPPGVIL